MSKVSTKQRYIVLKNWLTTIRAPKRKKNN